ncbi:MAG: hypothetical protein LBV80_00720 [Deltaproteobacteria bacterium]|jgi:hypothetical protein|nr:hypothetical protein [Deltaproteobacteria bacterium]
MNLKEAMAWEAEQVFLNPDEFAESEPIRLNGVACIAQIVGPVSTTGEFADGRPGVVFESATIHIAAGLVPLPRADREIDWNGQKWMVSEARDNMGLFKIEVYREKS